MTAIQVPSFVEHALLLLFTDEDGELCTRFGTEADLRDAVATLFWLHGADVRTEVKIPGCGRIDVLVEQPGGQTLIVEVKRAIRTETEARMAFQQAHAYYAYWCQRISNPIGRINVEAFVTAGHWGEPSATEAAEDAYYPDIRIAPWSVLAQLATRDCAWARVVNASRRSSVELLRDWLLHADCALVGAQEAQSLRALATEDAA